jgi:putative spermidine/putrescine transport system ATP-binding protein
MATTVQETMYETEESEANHNTDRRASAVELTGVSRHFGTIKAVDSVDLNIPEGEFFGMLGPSGSGKTTCLRLIAGFEQPTAGHLKIFGEMVVGTPPYRRAVNTVFQDYALFPHMNVLDNVAYALTVRGVGRKERHRQAMEMLELVRLPEFAKRQPGQLSGGQRQRVALARALVGKPRVLLLDEPLGALDLKLREQMQVELKALQRELGITFVFVTHDQGEALSMSDRVAVFSEGRVVQVGTPEDIYERPEHRFVADFVGSSNILEPEFCRRIGAPEGLWSLRPEKIHLVEHSVTRENNTLTVSATVSHLQYQGAVRRCVLSVAGGSLSLLVPSNVDGLVTGQTVYARWNLDEMHRMAGW